MTAQLQNQITPTVEQLNQVKQRINSYIHNINFNPDHRDGAYPYYLFHEAGTPIKGTVLMFHGFSARPHQMWRLADYLFQNGFNVYQATLAGHSFRIPDQYWPQVDLKPEYADPMREKISQDPVLASFLENLATGSAQQPGMFKMMGFLSRLRKLHPQFMDMARAIERNDDPDFDRYYTSNHLDYLKDGEQRLAELEAMPGPIYTVGLSVGGAVALSLGEAHPDRVKKVVAYAPLLEIQGEFRERYVNLAGPLDLTDMGWDDLRFPMGCFSAASRFGGYVCDRDTLQPLKNTPTLLVLTENEDAAEVKANQQFSRALGGESRGHYDYLYPDSDLVPHPMVDPEEVSQGMSNQFWQPMYQETFRFLSVGQFNAANMSQFQQDSSLPLVPPIA